MGKRKVVSDEEEEASGSDAGAVPLKKTKTTAAAKKAPVKKPASKKESKSAKAAAAAKNDNDIDEDGDEVMRNAGDSLIIKVKDGENGEKFVELGKTRRATVRAFNGKPLVDLREFYVDKKDGSTKPGKKGISLTIEQWEDLKKSMGTIDSLLTNIK